MWMAAAFWFALLFESMDELDREEREEWTGEGDGVGECDWDDDVDEDE